MSSERSKTIAERVARDLGLPGLVAALADRIDGPDLTSLLLEVVRRRVDRSRPADVLARYQADRFVAPSPITGRALRRAEESLLAAVPDEVDIVALAPLVPLGLHNVLGAVSQHNVVSTVRRTEVAADPTAGLALEAAVRRRESLAADPTSAEMIRLAGLQRITRAQPFEGPRSFAHFALLGLVTAGRDTGNLAFEKEALVQQIEIGVGGYLQAGVDDVEVALTDFSGTKDEVVVHVLEHFADRSRVIARPDPERTHARGYYESVCFKLYAVVDGDRYESGDGGFVDWGARLLSNAKERMLISGVSVDRIALDM